MISALPEGYLLNWFRVDRVLGRGSFGITYLGRDTNLDQPVAIKEFLPQDFAQRIEGATVKPLDGTEIGDTFRWGLDSFIKEARTLSGFEHPSIVRVLTVFEANGTAYMVMRYEPGATLAQMWRQQLFRDQRSLEHLLNTLAAGLKVVHAGGFIHRDIKPGNIYISEQSGPLLLDFGSARQQLGASGATQMTALFTPGYAPIEQCDAESATPQGPYSDIYSLAATLYHGITGQGPLDAMTRASRMLSQGHDALDPLAGMHLPDFTTDFLLLIDRGLALKAAERPQTIDQWLSEPGTTQAIMVKPKPPATATEADAPGGDETQLLPISPQKTSTGDTGQMDLVVDPRDRRKERGQSSRKGGAGRVVLVLASLAIAAVGSWAYFNRQAGGDVPIPPSGSNGVADIALEPTASPESPSQAATQNETIPRSSSLEPAAPASQLTPATEAVSPTEPAGEVAVAELPTAVNASSEASQPAGRPQAVTDETDVRRQQIAELLDQAARQYTSGRLIDPPGDNALASYQAVLDLEPNQPDGLAGIERVQLRLADGAIQQAQPVPAVGDGAVPALDAEADDALSEPSGMEDSTESEFISTTPPGPDHLAGAETTRPLDPETDRLEEPEGGRLTQPEAASPRQTEAGSLTQPVEAEPIDPPANDATETGRDEQSEPAISI